MASYPSFLFWSVFPHSSSLCLPTTCLLFHHFFVVSSVSSFLLLKLVVSLSTCCERDASVNYKNLTTSYDETIAHYNKIKTLSHHLHIVIFTFVFRAFSRCFLAKVTYKRYICHKKKPQHITIDKVRVK